MFNFLKKPKKITTAQTVFILIVLWLSATLLRVAATSGGNFPFWFDLGRDAILSREILEEGDLKIQGPNASGTNDTIYHGVLYYYLIGPLYTLFAGNPQLVLAVMIGFASLGVIPVYFLAKSISDDEFVAILTGVLYVFSYEFFTATTWLSNPIITTVSLPLFFWLYWLVFFQKRRQLFPLLMLALAVTHQSVILFAPWLGLIGVGLLMEHQAGNLKKWQSKHLVWGGVLYLLGIFSMILAQLKAYQAGIFNLQAVGEFASMVPDNALVVGVGMAKLIYLKIVRSLLPSLPVMSLLLAVIVAIFAKQNLAKPQQKFLLLVITSPLWLLSWHYRYVYHAFITLEIVGLILLAWAGAVLIKKPLGKIGLGIFLLIFMFSNFNAYKVDTLTAQSTYFVPQGAYFKHLLQTIDYTYQQAEGEKFSISTMTNPYGYNTMWSYLYDWYGLPKYGYKPEWYGPDQTGIFGGDLLERTQQPLAIHFSIREPGEGMPIWLFDDFNTQQEGIARSTRQMIGTMEVREHLSSNDSAE